MDSKRRPFIGHAPSYLRGFLSAVVIAVIATFAANAIQSLISNVISGSPYNYGPLVPPCVDNRSGWALDGAQITRCSSAGLTLAVISPPATGEDVFVDPHQAFPRDYRVSATVSQISPGSCAGILVRGHKAQATGYVTFICSRGVWEISRFDLHATEPILLASGQLPASPEQIYTVGFSTQGSVYQLIINGVVSGGGDENLYPGTDNVALLVSPSGSANFTNFTVAEIR